MDELVDLIGIGLVSGGRQRIVDLDLNVAPGMVWGLVGPNGAGKTSLLQLIAGLVAPTGGSGQVLGEDIRRRPGHNRHALGYLPQLSARQPDLTVAELLHFRAALHDVADRGATVAGVLLSAGLASVAGRRLSTLSGGWIRRAELAATLLHHPRLLLLDEPTTGLDQDARAAIWEVIAQVAAAGAGVIVNTHDLAEAERCDQLALLVEGRIRARGTPAMLLGEAGAATLAAAWPRLVHGR